MRSKGNVSRPWPSLEDEVVIHCLSAPLLGTRHEFYVTNSCYVVGIDDL